MLTLKETSGKVLIQSAANLISVGRESDNTLCLEVEAVSGYHGFFVFINNLWIYRDNFSTNGSFVNGMALRPGQARLLKSGDIIRLANYTLLADIVNSNKSDCIIVIKGFEAISTIEFPDLSGSLQIDANLISGYDAVPLTINRSPEGVISLNAAQAVQVNTKAHTGNLSLIDQDQIDSGDYSFLISYSYIPKRPSMPVPDRSYDPAKKMAESGKNAVFGNVKTDSSGVVKVGEFRAEMSMSHRLATIADDEATKNRTKIENAYAAFGVLVLFTSIFFVIFAQSLF